MRQFVQTPSRVVILSIVGLVVILLILGISVLKVIQSKPAVAHAQGSEELPQLSRPQSQTAAVLGQSTSSSNPSTSTKPTITAVPITPAQLASNQSASNIATDEGASINPQNTWHPVVGVVFGHVRYDASGNACGIGPTGTCYFPFAGRTIEIRTLKGVVVRSAISDSNGFVAFKLAPGTYMIVPGPGDTLHPTANAQQITVANGDSIDLSIDYWAIATTNAVH
jgi:hypothetical protein